MVESAPILEVGVVGLASNHVISDDIDEEQKQSQFQHPPIVLVENEHVPQNDQIPQICSAPDCRSSSLELGVAPKEEEGFREEAGTRSSSPEEAAVDPVSAGLESKRSGFWARQVRTKAFWYLILGIVIFLIVGVLVGSKIFEAIIGAKTWFLENWLISVPWYCFMFSVGASLLLPYSPFCISVGYIFGIGHGFIVQELAILSSSCFIYLVGKILLKKRVNEYLKKKYRLWKAIMDHMGKDWSEAAKINILMCFIPMPYGTHAYVFSISECPCWHFTLVFMVGMVGHTFLNLSLGDALAMASGVTEGAAPGSDVLRLVGTVGGALTMVVSIWYGGIVTQRIMEQSYSEEAMDTKKRLRMNGVDLEAQFGSSGDDHAANTQVEAARENSDADIGVDECAKAALIARKMSNAMSVHFDEELFDGEQPLNSSLTRKNPPLGMESICEPEPDGDETARCVSPTIRELVPIADSSSSRISRWWRRTRRAPGAKRLGGSLRDTVMPRKSGSYGQYGQLQQ